MLHGLFLRVQHSAKFGFLGFGIALLSACASSGGGSGYSSDTPIETKTIYGTDIRVPMPDDSETACDVDHRVWQRAQSLTPSTHHVLTCFSNTFDKEKLALGPIIYIVSTYKNLVTNDYNQNSFSDITGDIERQIRSEIASPTATDKGEGHVRLVTKSTEHFSWYREQDATNENGDPTIAGIYTSTLLINKKMAEITVSADLGKIGDADDIITIGERWMRVMLAANAVPAAK